MRSGWESRIRKMNGLFRAGCIGGVAYKRLYKAVDAKRQASSGETLRLNLLGAVDSESGVRPLQRLKQRAERSLCQRDAFVGSAVVQAETVPLGDRAAGKDDVLVKPLRLV